MAKETAREIIERINKEKREKRLKAKPKPILLEVDSPSKQKKQLEKIIAENKPSTLLTEIEKNLKNIHCEICNEPVPEHLLRGMFYKIIVDSKAVFKLLITGKSVGKTTNLILFQAWYLMNHRFGKFVWVFRTEKDKLEKGKNMWNEVLQEKLPLKNLPKFDEKDWKDNRGEEATGNGIMFQKKLRVRFCSLQEFSKTDSSFGRNAIHLVFDEAMPSNGKELVEPNETIRWHQIYNNVRNTEGKPTECYFLCNPHMKGAWFLRYFCHAEWIAEAFNPENEEKEHFFEGFKEVKDEKRGVVKPVPILLYQCPEREDENSFILDLIEDNPYRHKRGLFEKKEEMFISERPQMFYNGKEIYPFEPKMVIKECIYAKLKRNDQKFYFFRKAKEEKENIPEDIVHFCSTGKEYHESTYANKMLVEGEELKKWVRGFFYAMEGGMLSFCDSKSKFPDAYETKSTILPFIYQFDKDRLKRYVVSD